MPQPDDNSECHRAIEDVAALKQRAGKMDDVVAAGFKRYDEKLEDIAKEQKETREDIAGLRREVAGLSWSAAQVAEIQKSIAALDKSQAERGVVDRIIIWVGSVFGAGIITGAIAAAYSFLFHGGAPPGAHG